MINTAQFLEEYDLLLQKYSKTKFFGRVPVTHFLKDSRFKDTEIKDFYLEHALVLKEKIISGDYIDIKENEHPSICGGVTEYLTKIKLVRKTNNSLEKLRFFDDITKSKYQNLSDEELAFYLYEPDIRFRSGYEYNESIFKISFV